MYSCISEQSVVMYSRTVTRQFMFMYLQVCSYVLMYLRAFRTYKSSYVLMYLRVSSYILMYIRAFRTYKSVVMYSCISEES